MQKGCVNRQIARLPLVYNNKVPFPLYEEDEEDVADFAAVVLIDVDPRLDLIDLDLDDLRWVLASNYRPFRPTRSTSRVIAENRFFNLFLFAGDGRDGTAGTGRPSTAGHFDHHFVTAAARQVCALIFVLKPPLLVKNANAL